MGMFSSWSNFNETMAYTNDILRFCRDMVHKDGNTSFVDRMGNAGMNLFGNAASTAVADNIRRNTGSSFGYLAKYSAGGNGEQALYNTTQAGYYLYDLYHPYVFDQIYYDILPPYRAMSMLNPCGGYRSYMC